MAEIRIVTDSACDLPPDVADQLNIVVVPLTVRFGEQEYRDREELSARQFYAEMARSPVLPETAAPAPGAFEAAYRRLLDEGAAGVLALTLSSDLSATFAAATTAARAWDPGQVRVVDTRSITMGEGTMCVLAAEAARGGATLDDLVALVEGLIPRTRVYGALDTLENLKKGGRIGGAQALMGSLLSIKPILDLSSGKVEAESRQRTRARALRYLADKVAEHGAVERLAVMHGDAPDLPEFLDLLRRHYPATDILVGDIGATIGTHGGPRVIGVTFLVPGPRAQGSSQAG